MEMPTFPSPNDWHVRWATSFGGHSYHDSALPMPLDERSLQTQDKIDEMIQVDSKLYEACKARFEEVRLPHVLD